LVLIAPNNTATRTAPATDDEALYPRGWSHYSFNDACEPAAYAVFFNARASGTVNVAQNLAAAPRYAGSAYTTPPGLWELNAECVRRCGL
jgi:hypothetical protein